MADNTVTVDRFAAEVAPAVRELVASARAGGRGCGCGYGRPSSFFSG